ncbi:hypothetical protein L1887_39406 [Cichorium endivia]|nr:hypothetical protein L1887_39406 [Cichorium endivia]
MAEADPKRLRNKGLASNNDEIEDTTRSKPKRQVIVEVGMTNIEIMKQILGYRNRKGVCPTTSPDAFQKFCSPFIRMGVGNQNGWLKKMEEVKAKFNSEGAPTEDVDKQEYELWLKIWGE